MTASSPCTGVCKLDDATGWCLGCARSGLEISEWSIGTADWRTAIWSVIPERLAQLGVSCRRLPWTPTEIRDFAASSFEHGAGTWVFGVVGAVAEFTPAQGQTVDVAISDATIEARTKGGAIRMEIDDAVRALTFDPPTTPVQESRVVLAVKRERGRLPVASTISDLGEDTAPLDAADAGRLFDLGLGRKEARFCIRVVDEPTCVELESVSGLPLEKSLPRLGPRLVAASPTRVVETALGRIEVQGAIPRPDERSPDGPHTHLLPDHLATKRAMPVGMDLPRAYLPGGIFYP
ncbi:MAG: DUF1289 domain-containing protein [Pseudomonadota bacterium]